MRTLFFLTQSPWVLLTAVKCHPLHHHPPHLVPGLTGLCKSTQLALHVILQPALGPGGWLLVTRRVLYPWLPAGSATPSPSSSSRKEPGGAWVPQLRPSLANDPGNHCGPYSPGLRGDSLPTIAHSPNLAHDFVNRLFVYSDPLPLSSQESSASFTVCTDSFHALNDPARKHTVPILQTSQWRPREVR